VGWDPAPYQWATAGYTGAIDSGKTICGFLFSGAIFLGYLAGKNTIAAPADKDPARIRAIASVRSLFEGFIERFETTDCRTLTGCDFSQKTDAKRYFKEKIYENTCYHQFDYVLGQCLAQFNPGDGTS